MGKPPSPRVQEFMKAYKVDADEVWEVRQGSGNYAIKHSALERVAAERGITFDPPQISEKDSANKIVAMLVTARMGERVEWSFGEASPANNKNAYVYAMAEKRGKDRCILKLLNAHGTLYSEEELDDEPKRSNPHVTRPEDISDAEVEYDQYGNPIDNIPLGDERIERMKVADARPDYAAAQQEMFKIKDIDALMKWGKASANRVASWSTNWQEMFRKQFAEHRDRLRAAQQKEVA
jgi:hypothetical protein